MGIGEFIWDIGIIKNNMETEEQIFRDDTTTDAGYRLYVNGTFSRDDIYEKAVKEFHSQRLRHKMGGDKGIHLTIKNTEEDGN
jgi:hypothetical protein